MKLEINYLMLHPDRIRLVAGWIYNEFWTEKPGYSVETFVVLLEDAHDPDHIPLSFIAFADGEPAGTVNLIENDNKARPDLSPWLAALIVLPDYRRRGIGSALVRRCAREARRLGFTELFLGTDIPEFYSRLGAEHFDWASETLRIMRIPLTGASPLA